MHEPFETNGALSLVYGVEGLSNLRWMGDTGVITFRYLWESITASTQGKLCEEAHAGILLKKLDQSVKLRGDATYYDRQPEGHVHAKEHLPSLHNGPRQLCSLLRHEQVFVV